MRGGCLRGAASTLDPGPTAPAVTVLRVRCSYLTTPTVSSVESHVAGHVPVQVSGVVERPRYVTESASGTEISVKPRRS